MATASPSLGGVNYANCTIDELRTFLRNRRRRFNRFNNREQLTRKLRQLDEAWTFNFLDLHPEMRNVVYGELLLLDPATGRADNVNILRASKQTLREAEGLLYGLNKFEITVMSSLGNFPGLRHQSDFTWTVIHRDRLSTPRRSSRRGYIGSEYALLPKATIKKIQHLVLHVDLATSLPSPVWAFRKDDRYVVFHQKLLVLANAFTGCTALKKIDVDFTDLSPARLTKLNSEQLIRMFYPLTRLHANNCEGDAYRTINFNGFPHEIQTYLRESALKDVPEHHKIDTFGILADLHKRLGMMTDDVLKVPLETNTTLSVFKLAMESLYKECGMSRLVDDVKDISFCRKVVSLQKFYDLHKASWRGWITKMKVPFSLWARRQIERGTQSEADRWLGEQRKAFRSMMIPEVIPLGNARLFPLRLEDQPSPD